MGGRQTGGRGRIYEMAQHDSFTGRLDVCPAPNIWVVQHHAPNLHSPSGWLNAEAPRNIESIFVTLATLQAPSGWSNAEAPRNMQAISVTLSTLQPPSG